MNQWWKRKDHRKKPMPQSIFCIDDETNKVSILEDPSAKLYEDQRLFDNRIELLDLLMKGKGNGLASERADYNKKVNELITELMQQVKVYEPPDNGKDILEQQETNYRAP
ncbi:hypothetical protein SAMN04487896_0241 [Paenibacillus sp. ov031]|uniref:hypothetical protein n=1 Tax=Paenibacillus sp. ov031 TaxID=1761879 RepID=UPI000917DCF0|nr:hypothetical protein [Paenibacillus sp. ov031]SHN52693.1 hypothetical protein SAMN04487896_0241 [Paenibacillus sp. ov031]